jgi:hypothetical protein
MKKILLIYLFLISCNITSIAPHIGQHDYQFPDENKFPNGYKITLIFNENHEINYYKNFDMKVDGLKVDYERTIYKNLK